MAGEPEVRKGALPPLRLPPVTSQRRKRREETGEAFKKLAAQKTKRRRIAPPPRNYEALHWLETTLDWLNQWTEADDTNEMQPDRPGLDAGSVAGMDIEGPG